MALNQQLPFFNPRVPFCSPIQGGLLEGMSITVCGRVLPDANRFHVDLQNGSDVALHFNPRYNSGGYVIINSRMNGVWGEEKNKSQTSFPRGQLFALQILVTLSSYQISTNRESFSEFKHRIPFSYAEQICIDGKVELSLVAFQYLAGPENVCPPTFTIQPDRTGDDLQGGMAEDPQIQTHGFPYKSIIDGGLRSGKVIIIQGVINSEGMEIFLRHRTGIAFYYRPHFDENVIVCNSYEDGKWGENETYELTLIKIGEPLQVTIFCSCHGYEVFVNGQQTHTYSHRYANLQEIDVLDIRGDVQLSFVQP
uniref:Galectin n=1 Tax=Cyprinus carpio TaxID=7962 RepID=A0A8C1MP42_CYPCA